MVVIALLLLADGCVAVDLDKDIVLFTLGEVKSATTELGGSGNEILLALCSCSFAQC